ncbi:hypothetical protein AXG93_1660s1350 [Marchantia polymorpha subsp. ruderalis]|uniref:Uncharacterized protein n=1 Tax=Marchantia polymorpha subsp. ruderalis TaxID=1480154 RepID=A0A176VU26_MARPO|nr:hypothetical protein AXG93_1660s1350 [Marchantia polymorpha subsp. ruderalis]
MLLAARRENAAAQNLRTALVHEGLRAELQLDADADAKAEAVLSRYRARIQNQAGSPYSKLLYFTLSVTYVIRSPVRECVQHDRSPTPRLSNCFASIDGRCAVLRRSAFCVHLVAKGGGWSENQQLSCLSYRVLAFEVFADLSSELASDLTLASWLFT